MVASNTLQRYPETFDLAANAVNAALRGATKEGVDLFAKARQGQGGIDVRVSGVGGGVVVVEGAG